MNILFFSQAAWDDKNSFGNTVSNFFSGDVWKNDSFSSFYVRSKLPDNQCNVHYYNLSAVDIVKGIMRFSVRGREFTSHDITRMQDSFLQYNNSEQKNIDKLQKSNNQFIYFAHEIIWKSRIWLNKAFNAFLTKNPPDILFAFATSSYILWPLIKYLKKNTKCRIVLLIADDTYSNVNDCAWYRRLYIKKDLRKCIDISDKLYAISDEMSEKYSLLFQKEVTTIYKGCDLSQKPKGYINHPMRFVYAGNLFYGRDNTIAKIVEAIDKQNKNDIKARLEIYSGATITSELQQKLNRGNSSCIMGSRSYEEIKKIMHDSDIVLHVESFDDKQKETVRYSLSTKIIDCLQSGSQVVGIGPSGIASISFLQKVKGAIVIDNEECIEKEIEKLINNPATILARSLETRAYAQTNHEISVVQLRLRQDFEKLLIEDHEAI